MTGSQIFWQSCNEELYIVPNAQKPQIPFIFTIPNEQTQEPLVEKTSLTGH
jgi:hypothetical protein